MAAAVSVAGAGVARATGAAGVRTAAVLWGPFGRDHLEQAEPDYWLRRPEDIVGLVGGRPASSRMTDANPDQS